MKKMIRAMPLHMNIFDKQSQREIKTTDNEFGNFLLNKGLYDEIEITENNIFELADLVGGHVKINVYCPKCMDNRVFSCEAIPYYWYDDHNEEVKQSALEERIVSCQKYQNVRDRLEEKQVEPWKWTDSSFIDDARLMVFKFHCAMDYTHHIDYIVLTNKNKIMKIGQFPSVADLSFPKLKEYRKVMSKTDEKEFKRAIGLFASGIGIGSFVYLRRIFERIISSAGQKAIEKGTIDENVFSKAKVVEKIKMLSDYLPKALVDNPIFYGIISKGIHELSEENCLEFFPVLQSFIMMILRQWEKIRKDEEEEKKLAISLSNIAQKIK